MKIFEIIKPGSKIEFLSEAGEDVQFLRSLRRSFSQEELEIWNNNPPEYIVLATASLRKGYLVFLESQNFDFTQIPEFAPRMSLGQEFSVSHSAPLDFQVLVESQIHNGDGTLKPNSVLFLGYLHGVPVIVDPQTGETSENDNAAEQTRKKIDSVRHLKRYENKDIIFVGSDTVGWVENPNKQGVSLGKPRNHNQYPTQNDTESNSEYQERQQAFMFWYLIAHFTTIEYSQSQQANREAIGSFNQWYQMIGGTLDAAKDWVAESLADIIQSEETLGSITNIHKSALLFVRGDNERIINTDLLDTTERNRQLAMMISAINDEQYFPESAGAGAFQKDVFRQRWEDEAEYQISDARMMRYFEKVDPKLQPWYLLLHIMGVPVWAKSILQELN